MADTVFTWKIANLERELKDGCVYTAYWTVNAVRPGSEIDDEGNPVIYTAGAYGSVGFQRPDNLIPYDSLSEEIVIGWTKDTLDVDRVAEIEAGLVAQIEQQINPTSATGVPWN